MKLILIDANSYLHRAFHALPPLTTSQGQPVGALFGFAKTLLKILREQKPDHCAVCFDSHAPTFRHAQYAAYKATRKETDDALKAQLPRARELVDAWGLRAVALDGYEADDLIATLARRGAAAGMEVLIVTSDKDAMQLVAGPVRVLDEAKGQILDAEKVKAKFGVPPERIVDYLTLIGDTSDNVKGVAGIGPVTAVRLLEQFGSLDAVLALPAERAGKAARQVQTIQAARDTVAQGRRLIVLESQAPVDVKLEDLRIPQTPGPRLLDLLQEFEFTSMIPELYKQQAPPTTAAAPVWPETTLRALGKPAAVALAMGDGTLAVGAAGQTAFVALEPLSAEERALLQDLLASPKTVKRAHDLKNIRKGLWKRRLALEGPAFDTMLAGYCLNPSRARYALDDLALESLGQTLPPLTLPSPGGRGENPERLAAEPAAVSALAERLEKELKEKALWDLFQHLEMPLTEILADMEEAGIAVDRDYLRDLQEEFAGRLGALQQELYALAGGEVNLHSPKQLGVLLFQKFNLPTQKKTKTGFSTDEEVLRTLSAAHPFPAKLLDYREIAKLKSTYVDALLALADGEGRVHTHFLQTGAATGRLASTDPNLQNIPIRTPEGLKVRRAFVAAPGHVLLSADYSQIDLRVLAHLSGDANLRAAFAAGEDVHTRTAAEVFHIPPQQVGPDQRRLAKAINFGIAYGQTPHGLSQALGIPTSEAAAYIARYRERYAGVAAWIQADLAAARRDGSVRTLLGRIRYLPEINAKNGSIRAFAERVAMNTPIQGTSADIIKQAMIRIWRGLREKGFKTRMLLQIHDELLFEVPRGELDAAAPWIRSEMETAVRLDVPVEVGLKAGTDWQNLLPLNSKDEGRRMKDERGALS